MKKKYFLLTTLLTTLATTSCGYGLNEVYDGIPYNSTVYAENYYRDWDARIVEGGAKSKLTNVITRQLQVEQDKVFEKYSDPVFARIDSDAETLKYDSLDVNERYGTHKKLSNYDNSFRYGVKSKLFDGQMFCYGKYELARCQIDENGFGLIFDKETPYLDYFAMNLKASSDHTTGLEFPAYKQNVRLKVSFYCKNDEGYEKKTFTHILDVVANGSYDYTFFGFKVDKTEVSRVQGVSIEYDHLGDDLDNSKPLTEQVRALQKSLLIYEILLPNTTWR